MNKKILIILFIFIICISSVQAYKTAYDNFDKDAQSMIETIDNKGIVYQSVSRCSTIDGTYQANCYTKFALKNSDSSLCAKIEDDPGRSNCYKRFAIAYFDYELCENVNLKNDCISQVAVLNKDVSLCPEDGSPWFCDSIHYVLAQENKDLSECTKINYEQTKRECFKLFEEKGCSSIEDSQKKKECLIVLNPYSIILKIIVPIYLFIILILSISSKLFYKRISNKLYFNPFLIGTILIFIFYFIMEKFSMYSFVIASGEYWSTKFIEYIPFITFISLVQIFIFSILLYLLLKYVSQEDVNFLNLINFSSWIEILKSLPFLLFSMILVIYLGLDNFHHRFPLSPLVLLITTSIISLIFGNIFIKFNFELNKNKVFFWMILILAQIFFTFIYLFFAFIPLGILDFG